MANNQRQVATTPERIPVSLVSGFLGSGKTTLLNRILHNEHDRRIGVLVNDFGDVNIDSQLISRVEGETISLTNGCVCCTIRDDLVTAVTQMTEREPVPDAIIIETSGVSEPNAAAMSLVMSTDLAARTRLDAIITVVDADQVRQLDEDDRHLALDQIHVADIVVINKTDLVGKVALESLQVWIKEIAPRARQLTASYGEVPLELLLGTGSHDIDSRQDARGRASGVAHGKDHDHSDHAHAGHDASYSSLSWTDGEPLAFQAIYHAFSTLPLGVFRAKGILNLREVPERRAILQMVGKRVILTKGEPWAGAEKISQIVMIGRQGGIDRPSIERTLRACRADVAPPDDNPFAGAVVEILRRD